MMEIVFGRCAYGTMKYMGIAPTDLYCFNFGLSMGDLAKKEVPDLTEMKARLNQGEALRLWYSPKSPEESCCFCWLMAQIAEIKAAEVYISLLPPYFELPDNCTMTCNSWGEVEPERWAPLLEEKIPLPVGQRVWASMHWKELEEENAPLRAIVNGSLVSVPADFYDHFIRRELEKQEDTFMEARLIGHIMNTYQLGIGDELLHQRIEAFIEKGLLQVVSPAAEGKLYLRRILKKMRK